MYINEYKILPYFNSQYYYLKEYFKNPRLSSNHLKKEMKEHFKEFLLNTKISKAEEFHQFYQLLLDEEIFSSNIKDHLFTILNFPVIDASTLFQILNECDQHQILTNSQIQNRLIHFVLKEYHPSKLEIIENYISKEYKNMLFLLQIEYRLQELFEPQELKFYYTFVKLLLLDLKQQNELHISYKGHGGYKSTFQIGDYLLQIGEGPHIKDFPKTSRVSAPLMFKIFHDNQISISFVLNTSTTEKERQDCWIKAREENVLLLDAKKDNFGKYDKDYIHPFKDISEQGKNFLGIDRFDLSDTKKGEVKYLDVDFYISSEDDSYENECLAHQFYYHYKDFEHQYMKKYKK